MTFTATTTFRQGSTQETATGRGETRGAAMLDAFLNLNVGFRPSRTNTDHALVLLDRWDEDERPESRYLREGHAYLQVDEVTGGPVIEIGWTTTTFTEVPNLWSVQAQVETQMGQWSGSRQVPTFYLDPQVQGALDEEAARRVAEDILHTLSGDDPGVQLHVTIAPVF